MKKKLVCSLLLGAALAVVPSAAFAQTVTIDLGNPIVSKDAQSVAMQSVAGVSEDGVILVPVRDVAEVFDGTVVYNAEQNLVKLTFPNGNWADITITATEGNAGAVSGDTDGIVSIGTFIDDKLYIPADLMATCLGARMELIDYGQDEIFRLIYHVR